MIKKICKITLVFIVLSVSFFVALISYPFSKKKLQDIIMKHSSKALLKILGIKVNYNVRDYWNGLITQNSKIIVCNHISYLDIPVLLSCFEGRFVAAKEIKKWPVLGWEIAMLGHIFIERGNKESYEKINNAVKEGNTIIIFPEGHTSPGETIGKFKDGAFVAALKNQAPILPVVIKYNNKEAAWYGGMSLIPHLWRICDQEIEAHLYAGEIVYCNKNINLSKKVIRDLMLDNYNDIVVRHYG